MFSKKLAHIISIFTTAPMFAVYVITYIYTKQNSRFSWYALELFFLTLLPISAYWLKNLIPSIKEQGRRGARKLAFIMGVMSYISGTILCLVLKVPAPVMRIFSTYCLAGGTLALINKFTQFRASGHACGVAGPIVLLIDTVGGLSWFWILLIPLVYWARLKLKRHNLKELVIGTLVGIASALVNIALVV